MSPSKGTAHSDRIKGLRERIDELGKKGVDIARIAEILNNLDATLGNVKDEKKVEAAFDKFEKLLTKFEEKSLKGKEEAPEAMNEESEEIPRGVGEKEKEGEEKAGSKKMGKEEPDATRENGEEATKGKKQAAGRDEEEPDPVSEPEKPPREDAAAEGEGPEVEEGIARVETLASEVRDLGGDTTPIQPHIDEMMRCREAGDEAGFRGYMETSRDWLGQYLTTLLGADMESIIAGLLERFGDFARVGRSDAVKEMESKVRRSADDQGSMDIDALRKAHKGLKKIESRMDGKFKELTEDLTRSINEACSRVEGIIKDISEDMDTASLKDELQDVKDLLFNGEYIEAEVRGKDLVAKAVAEKDSKEMSKLESLLLSIEPLMKKLEEHHGEGSSDFKEMKKEQKNIIERSKTDPKDALKLMEEFLDKISMEAAKAEESHVKSLQGRIGSLKKEMEDLEQTIDVSPITTILEKAENLVIDGTLDGAGDMIDKAVSAFKRLKEKKAVEVATYRIKEIKDRMKSMEAKGVDISPLEGPVEEASKYLDGRDMESFEKALTSIDGKLVLINNEELKLDYQKLLIKIMNNIKQLREREPDKDAVVAAEGIANCESAEEALGRGSIHEAYLRYRDAIY
ncbi:MAG: hypothetical protein ACMUHY_01505, partial [Thermoplasmatota archaeon]